LYYLSFEKNKLDFKIMSKINRCLLLIFLCFGLQLYSQVNVNGSFMPLKGKYKVSDWVKEALEVQTLSYDSSSITIVLADNGKTTFYSLTIKPTAIIIDGWHYNRGNQGIRVA
jgi:hypothetical protein